MSTRGPTSYPDGRRVTTATGEPGVYAIHPEGEPFVKIGWTQNLGSRLTALQSGNPRELRPVFWADCELREVALTVERQLHERFSETRTHGEWFRVDDALDAFLSDPPTVRTWCPVCETEDALVVHPTLHATCGCVIAKGSVCHYCDAFDRPGHVLAHLKDPETGIVVCMACFDERSAPTYDKTIFVYDLLNRLIEVRDARTDALAAVGAAR